MLLQVIIKVELSLIHNIGIINVNISLHTLLFDNNTGEINENALYFVLFFKPKFIITSKCK